MSTNFGREFGSFPADIANLKSYWGARKGHRQSLTGLRVRKAGRPHLDGGSPYGQVLKHVVHRLDASQADDWYLHCFLTFPHEPERDGQDGRTGKATG